MSVPTTMTAKPSSQIELIPWDPNSPSHVARLFQQRLQCGWKTELVKEIWPAQQREGRIALQWIVISISDPSHDSKLATHLSTFPTEAVPLLDTAATLGGKPRSPSSSRTFIPVGHISLDSEYETSGYLDPEPGTYFISSFYVSTAIQQAGLGRAAMDVLEATATAEPLCARVLALSTVPNEYTGKKERLEALGRTSPLIQNQTWYERRGYKEFLRFDNFWHELDATGKEWPCTAIFMRKDIT